MASIVTELPPAQASGSAEDATIKSQGNIVRVFDRKKHAIRKGFKYGEAKELPTKWGIAPGEVVQIEVRHRKSYCFIEFRTAEIATQAIEKCAADVDETDGLPYLQCTLSNKVKLRPHESRRERKRKNKKTRRKKKEKNATNQGDGTTVDKNSAAKKHNENKQVKWNGKGEKTLEGRALPKDKKNSPSLTFAQQEALKVKSRKERFEREQKVLSAAAKKEEGTRKRIAWHGGKITHNKEEALAAFLKRKGGVENLTEAQRRSLQALQKLNEGQKHAKVTTSN